MWHIEQISCIKINFEIDTELLGKYLKIKPRKFCGIRHEALGPPPPPPFVSNFAKKIKPHFFLEIESMIAKTKFTLGPIENSFFLLQLKWFTFPINWPF